MRLGIELGGLLMGIVLLAGLATAWVGSLVWAWRDADRRGQPGFIVTVLVAMLFWPLSLVVWVLARPKLAAATALRRPLRMWPIVTAIAAIPLLALVVSAAILVPSLFRAHESARRASCMNNQKQIAIAYAVYANRHHTCPKTFDDLREFGVTDSLLRCPSAADKTQPSYLLFPGTNAGDIIIRENPGNHRGGGNVAYRDGLVAWAHADARPAMTGGHP